MNTDIVQKASGLNALQVAAVVTMDDVVSAFVSKYETQLFGRKKELSAELARTQADIKELTDAVRAKIDTSSHNATLPLGLVAEASKDVTLDFEKGRAGFQIVIRPSKQKERDPYVYGGGREQITITQFEPIPGRDVTAYGQLIKLHDSQQTALAEVLDKIKSIARKEREVRGRIAMRKIEESGYLSLLDDAQLLELVTLS